MSDDPKPLRFYEAWTIVALPDGTRDVDDECGHVHDTLADVRDVHRLHPFYNAIVALDYNEAGVVSVAKEYRHAPRRPRGFIDRMAFDINTPATR